MLAPENLHLVVVAAAGRAPVYAYPSPDIHALRTLLLPIRVRLVDLKICSEDEFVSNWWLGAEHVKCRTQRWTMLSVTMTAKPIVRQCP